MAPTDRSEDEVREPRDPRVLPALLKAGELADRYEVQRELGRGTRGQVWLVRDRAAGELWALKASADVAALRDEWDCLRQLRGHPRFPKPDRFGTASIESAEDTEGISWAYFTMEWIDGESLDQCLPKLSVEEVRELFCSACSALGFLHRAGWIHGDVKPENMCVSRAASSGQGSGFGLHLLDFSLARRDGVEVPGWIRGTPLFAAPSILQGEPADRSSDLYSLGRSFLESGFIRSSDEELASLLDRMVEVETGARYATVEAVFEDSDSFREVGRQRSALDASLSEPPYQDLGGRLEGAVESIRDALEAEGPILEIGFPRGGGRSRFLFELRNRLLGEGVETVIPSTTHEDAEALRFASVVLRSSESKEEPSKSVGSSRGGLVVHLQEREGLRREDDLHLVELEAIARSVLNGAAGQEGPRMVARCTAGFVSWTVGAARAIVAANENDLLPFELREQIGEQLPDAILPGLLRSAPIPATSLPDVALLGLSPTFTYCEAEVVLGDRERCRALLDGLLRAAVLVPLDESSRETEPRYVFLLERDAVALSRSLSEEDRARGHAAWLRAKGNATLRREREIFEHAIFCGDTSALLQSGRALMAAALEGQRASEAARWLDCVQAHLPGDVEDFMNAEDLTDYLEVAGDALRVHRSAKDALSVYERIALPASPSADAAVRLLRKRSICLDALGEHAAAFQLMKSALDLEGEVSWREEVQIYERLGEFSAKLGDMKGAEAWLRRGLEVQGAEAESLEVSCIWNNMGIIVGAMGSAAESREHHERALAIREALSDDEGISRSLTNLAWSDLQSGDLEQAEERTVRALEIKRRLGQVSSLTSTLSMLGEVHQRRGNLSQAIAELSESLNLQRSIGEAEGEVASRLTLSELWFDLGRFEEALEHSDAGLEALRRNGLRWALLPASLLFRSQLDAALGRKKAALRYASSALREAKDSDVLQYIVGARAQLAILSQEHRLTGSEAKELEAQVLSLDSGGERVARLMIVSRALGEMGSLQVALRLAQLAGREAKDLHSVTLQVKASYTEALCWLRMRENTAATSRRLHESIEGAERLGLLEVRWRAYQALAELHRAAGRKERALGWFGKCTDVFSMVVGYMHTPDLSEEYLESPERVEVLETLEALLSPDSPSAGSLGSP